MILLVWSSEKAQECATAVEQAFQTPVHVVPNIEAAREELNHIPFFAVLLDQHLWDGFPSQAELLLQHLGDAAPIIINFAISTTDRVLRDVKSGLDRWTRISHLARRNASAILLSELKDEITAIFLSCGMALRDSGLSPPATEHVRKIEGLAEQIRQKLAAESVASAAHA